MASKAFVHIPVLDFAWRLFFFDLGLSVYYFLFNLYLTGRGYSEQQLGMVGSAMAAGALMAALPASLVIGRIGMRRTFLSCQLLLVCILCGRVLAASMQLHIILAFCAGMIFSIWAVSLSPLTAALVPEESRPRAFSFLFSAGIGLGALGGVAGSRIPQLLQRSATVTHSDTAMKLTLFCGIALAALGVIFSAKLPEAGGRRGNDKVKRFVPPGSGLFFVALAGWSFVTGSFSPFAGVYFTKHFGMPLREFGNVFFLCQAAQVVAVLAAPYLARRWGPGPALLVSQFAVGVCLTLVGLASHAGLSAAAYVLETASQWMIEPIIYARLMNMAPAERRGDVSASMTLVIGCSQLVSAGLAGWAFSHLGYLWSLLFLALIAILTGATFNFSCKADFTPSPTHLPISADAD